MAKVWHMTSTVVGNSLGSTANLVVISNNPYYTQKHLLQRGHNNFISSIYIYIFLLSFLFYIQGVNRGTEDAFEKHNYTHALAGNRPRSFSLSAPPSTDHATCRLLETIRVKKYKYIYIHIDKRNWNISFWGIPIYIFQCDWG